MSIYRYADFNLLYSLDEHECASGGIFAVLSLLMIKLKSLLESSVNQIDLDNPVFMSGVNLAIQDKKLGQRRDLKKYKPDFIRGYKTVGQESWWDKANAKLTQWASQFGSGAG